MEREKIYRLALAIADLMLAFCDDDEEDEETAAADADDPAELIPKNTSDCDGCPHYVNLTKHLNPELKCIHCDEKEGCCQHPKKCYHTVGYCGYMNYIGVSLGSGIAEGEKICGIGEEEWQRK